MQALGIKHKAQPETWPFEVRRSLLIKEQERPGCAQRKKKNNVPTGRAA